MVKISKTKHVTRQGIVKRNPKKRNRENKRFILSKEHIDLKTGKLVVNYLIMKYKIEKDGVYLITKPIKNKRFATSFKGNEKELKDINLKEFKKEWI